MGNGMKTSGWEHFPHQADIGIRGSGATKEEAFGEAAMALTAVITKLELVRPIEEVRISCHAANDELLFVDWLKFCNNSRQRHGSLAEGLLFRRP